MKKRVNAENEGQHDLTSKKEYFIPVNHKLIPVSKEVYEEYFRPIWRTHYHARKHGQCSCLDWRRCEGDCGLCRYRTAGQTISLDLEREDVGDIRPDPSADIESIVLEKILLEELLQALNELDPDSRRIIELFSIGKSEREIALDIGLSQKAVNKRKTKIFNHLRERLKYFS